MNNADQIIEEAYAAAIRRMKSEKKAIGAIDAIGTGVSNLILNTNRQISPVSYKSENKKKASANSANSVNRSNEERAAIAEFDGELPREWAEAFAKLQGMDRPEQYNQTEWEQVINDAGLFANKWAYQAIALGWTVMDAFAVHESNNRRRLDGEGVLLSIRGRNVVAITESHVMIETKTGARQRICKPTAPENEIKTITQGRTRK